MGAAKGNKNALGHGCGRPKYWTDEKIIEEAEFLLNWCQRDDALVMGTCYGMRGYSHAKAWEFERKSEFFKDAKALALTIVGSRREHGALVGDYDVSLVRASLAAYDPEYRGFLKEMKRSEIIEDIKATEAAREISEHLKSKKQVCVEEED